MNIDDMNVDEKMIEVAVAYAIKIEAGERGEEFIASVAPLLRSLAGMATVSTKDTSGRVENAVAAAPPPPSIPPHLDNNGNPDAK